MYARLGLISWIDQVDYSSRGRDVDVGRSNWDIPSYFRLTPILSLVACAACWERPPEVGSSVGMSEQDAPDSGASVGNTASGPIVNQANNKDTDGRGSGIESENDRDVTRSADAKRPKAVVKLSQLQEKMNVQKVRSNAAGGRERHRLDRSIINVPFIVNEIARVNDVIRTNSSSRASRRRITGTAVAGWNTLPVAGEYSKSYFQSRTHPDKLAVVVEQEGDSQKIVAAVRPKILVDNRMAWIVPDPVESAPDMTIVLISDLTGNLLREFRSKEVCGKDSGRCTRTTYSVLGSEPGVGNVLETLKDYDGSSKWDYSKRKTRIRIRNLDWELLFDSAEVPGSASLSGCGVDLQRCVLRRTMESDDAERGNEFLVVDRNGRITHKMPVFGVDGIRSANKWHIKYIGNIKRTRSPDPYCYEGCTSDFQVSLYSIEDGWYKAVIFNRIGNISCTVNSGNNLYCVIFDPAMNKTEWYVDPDSLPSSLEVEGD